MERITDPKIQLLDRIQRLNQMSPNAPFELHEMLTQDLNGGGIDALEGIVSSLEQQYGITTTLPDAESGNAPAFDPLPAATE